MATTKKAATKTATKAPVKKSAPVKKEATELTEAGNEVLEPAASTDLKAQAKHEQDTPKETKSSAPNQTNSANPTGMRSAEDKKAHA